MEMEHLMKMVSSFLLLKLEIYCDEHSLLSSIQPQYMQYAFHIYLTVYIKLSNFIYLLIEKLCPIFFACFYH